MMTFGKALLVHIQTAMDMIADAERGYAMLRSVGLSTEDARRVVQASQRGDDDPVMHHRRLSAAGLERGCEALRRASINAEEVTRAFARFCPPTRAENDLLDWRLSKQGKRQARRRGV